MMSITPTGSLRMNLLNPGCGTPGTSERAEVERERRCSPRLTIVSISETA